MGAYRKSDSAKKAVIKVLDRRDEQDDLERVVKLVSVLKIAEKSVNPWIPGKPAVHRQGRSRDTDLAALFDAANFLRTNPPLDAGEDLQDRIKGSADQIDDLIEGITNDPENMELWKSAQLVLLDLILFLEKTMHKMKKSWLGN